MSLELKNARETLVHDRRCACPGLFRMAQARDGGICRVKLTFGQLTSDQARGIADASEQFGNGIIDVTNRANVQIRGVQPHNEDALIDSLLGLGLGPLTDKGDDVRNVMISPFAGADKTRVDIRPLATSILRELQTSPIYQTLSPKFCIFVDGGENIAMVTHPHDVWLSPINPGDLASDYAFGIAGVPPVDTSDLSTLGMVSANQTFKLVTAILDLFIEWNRDHPEASRLRHMLADIGKEKFVDLIKQKLAISLQAARVREWRRTSPKENGHLGIVRTPNLEHCTVGAMPSLGRLNPDMLRNLASIADRYSSAALQLTPWQSILFSGVANEHATAACDALRVLGLSTSSLEPLATMISCSGAAGCKSALASTQLDGIRLAALLAGKADIPQIHLTGCSKSCASPLAKPVTLVATSAGHYDIFLHATNGPSRFGKLLASNRTIEESADLIGAKFGSGGPLHA
ncbi:precorrin-3B synthase [Phyllobacterium sp. YR531]|uniref:precorrin-3B synthase n=1 Tax=Phyllobacterium sp. YR531 TaxID=1144343 RepID=UPI0009D9E262|nr:precorrin-3B synthase [Phyllobacterium sp. YR531]